MKKITTQHVINSFEQDYYLGFKDRKNAGSLTPNQTLLKNATLGVEKYELLHVIYSRAYGETYSKISESVKDRYFNKMFSYLEKVDLSDIDSLLEIIPSLDENTIKKSFSKLLYYFQDLEEYEKCAVVKKVLDNLIK
jgi:hypothetical protein